MRARPEFGNIEGELLVVKMALNGLKYLGAKFTAFLAEMLSDIGFRSSIADPHVLMRADTRPIGEAYYKYIMCYVDDILCIIYNDRKKMGEIQKNMKFKNNIIEDPDFYLGDSLKKK